MTKITLVMTSVVCTTGNVHYSYHWFLESKHHFLYTLISGKTYSLIWSQLVSRAVYFRCLPEKTIFEVEDGTTRRYYVSEFIV